jgi:L-tyrosine isonitrile synthase
MSHQVSARVLPAVDSIVPRPQSQRDQSAARQARVARFPQPRPQPDRVLRSFNTRAIKREQPDDPDQMLRFIAEAMSRNQPVPFAMYWGKGPRSTTALPEHRTLDFIGAMVQRIRDVYQPGASVSLICTDTHANLNGHAPESIRSYFDAVSVCAAQRGFDTCWLGDLVRFSDVPPLRDDEHQAVPAELMSTLRNCAAKWFRGDGSIEEGALRYYRLNMVERQVVERAFPSAIFTSFNGSEMRELLPAKLPIFYMFSLRHGVSDKPWFLPADFGEAAAANVHRLPQPA